MADALELDEDELLDIIEGGHGEWVAVTPETIEDQGRWTTHYTQVFKHREMDRYVSIGWDRGSTEYQDNGTENIYFIEVRPVQVTRTEYVAANKDA